MYKLIIAKIFFKEKVAFSVKLMKEKKGLKKCLKWEKAWSLETTNGP